VIPAGKDTGIKQRRSRRYQKAPSEARSKN